MREGAGVVGDGGADAGGRARFVHVGDEESGVGVVDVAAVGWGRPVRRLGGVGGAGVGAELRLCGEGGDDAEFELLGGACEFVMVDGVE